MHQDKNPDDRAARLRRLKVIALADLLLRSSKSDTDLQAARTALGETKAKYPIGSAQPNAMQGLRHRIAVHESGHALAHYIILGKSNIKRLFLEGEESALETTTPPETITADLARKFMVIFLAGRAAEERIYGRNMVGNGAGLDLSKATALAYEAITELGFDEAFGLISFAGFSHSKRAIPPSLLSLAEQRTVFWLKNAHLQAKALLAKHHIAHAALLDALLVRNSLSGDEVAEIIYAHRID